MVENTSPGVLIIDDQPDLRALLQTILRHHGFSVFLAQNGPDGALMFRISREKISLVLIDADLPDWDGPKTLRELQKIQPDMIACFIAGEKRRRSDQELIALGAARVIHKPFEPSELARQLWELGSIRDRRDGERRVPQSTRVKVGPGIEPEYVVESWIGDRSSEGLRLRMPEKLGEVGAILSIRSPDADDEIPWIPVQIRHIRSEAGMWTAGCRLLHPAARDFV